MRWIAVLLMATATTAWGQALPARTDARIEALIRPMVGKATPGLAVLVIDKGNVLHAGAYGVRDVATLEPFTTTTPVYIASLAKMFTALGVLQLVDQGKLTLDATIGSVLPDVAAYARDVTVRQLLNHTAGLIDHYDVGGEDRTYSKVDVLKILDDADSLLFQPGSKSSYSNSAYVLLALVIEKLSGKTYAQFVDQRFLRPAGMRNATVVATARDLPARRARGYARKDNGFALADYDAINAPGPGGIYASLEDLYRWSLALRSGRVVSRDAMKTASTATVLTSGRDTEWGMGWLAEFHGRKDVLAGRTYVAAFGSLRGFRALLKWYQQDDLIVVWLANSDSNEVFDALGRIPAMILTGPAH